LDDRPPPYDAITEEGWVEDPGPAVVDDAEYAANTMYEAGATSGPTSTWPGDIKMQGDESQSGGDEVDQYGRKPGVGHNFW